MAKDNQKSVQYFKDDWGRIIVTDANGNSYTLYAVHGNIDLTRYELPPLPPAGLFDVRFSSGRIAEDLSSTQSILVSGVTYPLKIKVENMSVTLKDESGKEIHKELNPGDEISINKSTVNKLMATEELIPNEYSLEQNFPNPFNSTTNIRYSVPADGFVNISIYNTLGEKVTEIVNGFHKAGNYQVRFTASELSSGIYIYRMKSGGNISVKKMMILK
jgi:hypothetical protein